MKKIIFFLFAILSFRASPQSGDIGTHYPLHDTTHFIVGDIPYLKYSIASSDLNPAQINFNLESISFPVSDEDVSNKSPWLAFGLSMLYPGAGQLYNGDYGKALLMAGLGTLGLGAIYLAATSIDFDSESNPDYLTVIFISGMVVGGGAYLWSMIDAPISASKINERNRKSGITLFSTENEKVTVGLKSREGINNFILNYSMNF